MGDNSSNSKTQYRQLYVKVAPGEIYAFIPGTIVKVFVKEGEKVTKGQIIGTMGCTGSCSGTHLDFRVKKDGEYINPMTLYN